MAAIGHRNAEKSAIFKVKMIFILSQIFSLLTFEFKKYLFYLTHLIDDVFQLQNSHTNKSIFPCETVISDTNVKLVKIKLFFWGSIESAKIEPKLLSKFLELHIF